MGFNNWHKQRRTGWDINGRVMLLVRDLPTEVSGDDPEPAPRKPLKEPSEDAIAVYRYRFATGKTQVELSEDPLLMQQLGRAIDQGTVSRYLKQVKEWVEAGNVLPPLTEPLDSKPTPIDPERIDLGKRVDGRAANQRGRRNSDEGDR